MEDPMRNRCLEPRSLVMTPSECFYCFGQEGIYCSRISFNFGIKSCRNHYNTSIRDCKAYMHRNHIVRIIDIIKVCESFFELLKMGFPVLRSNGCIEEGWTICEDSYEHELIDYDNTHDEWTIPVRKDNIRKRILISDMLKPDILTKLPSTFEEKFCELIILLNNGIYKYEHDTYELLVDKSKSTQVEDIAEVVPCMVNGVLARVFLPPM